MSDLTIIGLCMVAVASSVNADQLIPPTYYVDFADRRLLLAEWWGRGQELRDLVARWPQPQVTLDFGDWMTGR
jgi:hypothetical protein